MDTLATTGLGLLVAIANAIDGVQTIQQKCRVLRKQVDTIRSVLKQIQQQAKDRKHFSSSDEAALGALVEALRNASRIVEKLAKTNKFKMAIMAKNLSDDLNDASNEIQICLGSVSLMTVGLQGDLKEDLRSTTDLLREFRDEYKKQSRRSAAEDDKIHQVLEAVKNQENRDRDLLQQFAEIYDTDRESIKADLQEFKDWREQCKSDLLYDQLMLAISQLDDENSCPACPRTMEELECPICRMLLTDPMIVVPSGCTYCRECLDKALLLDARCPEGRSNITASVENRVVASIIQLLHHQMPQKVSSQVPPNLRLDVPNAAEAFQSSCAGSILVGLTALQLHCRLVPKKREIISTNGLVSYLVKFALSPRNERPPGSLEIALVILEELTALNGPPDAVLTNVEMESVHVCLREEGLEHLVALMCTGTAYCRLRAAQVMVNAMGGSFECLCFARTLSRLVTAFYDLAVGDLEGHKLGLAGLHLLARREFGGADEGRKDQVVVELLMDLIRSGLGVEEALVALVEVLTSSEANDIFSALLDSGTHLVWLVETLPAGDGRNASVKILLFMAEDVESKRESKQKPSTSLREIPSPRVLARMLLKILANLDEDNKGPGALQEDCVMLLYYVLKYGRCRLEPNQVLSLADIVLQERASVKGRTQVLTMCCENLEIMPIFDNTRVAQLLQLVKPHWGDSGLRCSILRMICSMLRLPEWCKVFRTVAVKEADDVPACFEIFCSVVALDTDELCRGYGAVALEILSRSRTDGKVLEHVKGKVTLNQLVRILQSKGPDEVSGAAAALISMLVSDSDCDPEVVVKNTLMHLAELLQDDSRTAFKEEAAKAFVNVICRKWEVARDWVASSEANVVAGFISFAQQQLPAHSKWRGQLYDTLTLLCSDAHCKPAVVQAHGQLLLLEALLSGSQTAASQRAALAFVELVTTHGYLPGVDLGRVVVAVTCKLRREKVDPTMVAAFVRLCGDADCGKIVLKNEGVEVLVDMLRHRCEECTEECSRESSQTCCSAAALGLEKLASLKLDQDDGAMASSSNPAPSTPSQALDAGCRSRIVNAKGISVLLDRAGSGCVAAAQALGVLAEETSAKAELAEHLAELRDISKRPGRMQDLILSVLGQLNLVGLPHQSLLVLLDDGFLDRLLGFLETPSAPSAVTAVKILRELFVACPGSKDNMLRRGDGAAVKGLLQVVKDSCPAALRDGAMAALEAFVLEEAGRLQFIEQNGVKVVLDVLKESPTHGQARLHAMRILASLSSPNVPKPSRKVVWDQICTAQIFSALVEELDPEASNTSSSKLAAIRLIAACVGEATEVSKLCGTLREKHLPRALAKLRFYCHEEVVIKSHRLVELLATKSRRTSKALKFEIDKVDADHKDDLAERDT